MSIKISRLSRFRFSYAQNFGKHSLNIDSTLRHFPFQNGFILAYKITLDYVDSDSRLPAVKSKTEGTRKERKNIPKVDFSSRQFSVTRKTATKRKEKFKEINNFPINFHHETERIRFMDHRNSFLLRPTQIQICH